MGRRSIAIVGPTASGKTGRAVDVARAMDGEIISADSRQVYCRMDIGTGKDLKEYGEIKYHLIDIAPAGYKYNLYQYLRDFNACHTEIQERDKLPVICGGTGMYVENAIRGLLLPEVPENKELRNRLRGESLDSLEAMLRGYKTLHNTTDIDTVQRAIRAIEIEEYYTKHPESATLTRYDESRRLDVLVIGIDIDREARRNRISKRLRDRIDEGMIDEIRGLIDSGISPVDLIYYGLEYKYVTEYILERISKEEMFRQLEIAIHQFAKRQMTWFRGMERRGTKIHWLPYDLDRNEFVEQVKSLYQ